MLRLIIFLIINFAALGIGSALAGNPGRNEWYLALSKAPWTPPGWFFGVAWMSIMICFSIFLWRYSERADSSQLKLMYILFAVQFILNVLWNPVFFSWHFPGAGLIIITALEIIVGIIFYLGLKQSLSNGLLMLPYFLWLLVAASLNAYVMIYNQK